MAVGTGAISLQDVVNEIAGTQTSLQDCIDDHNPAGIDPTYGSAPITSLAEFRGYTDNPISTTAFSLDPSSESTSAITACGFTLTPTTYYHDGAGIYPGNGDTIYINSIGTTVFAGNSKWYKSQASGLVALRITNAGLVDTAPFSC